MLYILHSNLLKSFSYAVIEQCCLWFHHSYVIQSYHCLITYSDRKSSDCTINSDNNNNVVTEVSAEEEDSEEDLIREEDEDREDREEDRVLFSSLKEAEREDKSVLISRETHWDDSVSDESIDELYKYLLALFKHHMHWACMYVYTQSSFQDSEEDYVTTNSMTAVNSISKIMTEHCQLLKQTLSVTESREIVSCIKQQLIKQLKDEISRKETAQDKIFKKEDMYEDLTIKTTVSELK